MRFIAKTCCYLIVLLLAGLWLKPPVAFVPSPVVDVPWSINPSRVIETKNTSSNISVEESQFGGFAVFLTTHLANITPKMLHWFYRHQADRTATYAQENHSWFKFAHPNAHSEIMISDSPDPYSDQLMSGVTFVQKEVIGDHPLTVQYRIKSFGDEGMTLELLHSGYAIGLFDFQFTHSGAGTRVTLNGNVGLEIPVIGPISNFYIFNKVYPKEILNNWMQHLMESFEHKQQLIPQLYSQKDQQTYTLS